MIYAPIDWSPFATNILDAGEYDLCKPDGTPVELQRSISGLFILLVDGQRLVTDCNLTMSSWMNKRQIGGVKKQNQR